MERGFEHAYMVSASFHDSGHAGASKASKPEYIFVFQIDSPFSVRKVVLFDLYDFFEDYAKKSGLSLDARVRAQIEEQIRKKGVQVDYEKQQLKLQALSLY